MAHTYRIEYTAKSVNKYLITPVFANSKKDAIELLKKHSVHEVTSILSCEISDGE